MADRGNSENICNSSTAPTSGLQQLLLSFCPFKYVVIVNVLHAYLVTNVVDEPIPENEKTYQIWRIENFCFHRLDSKNIFTIKLCCEWNKKRTVGNIHTNISKIDINKGRRDNTRIHT